MIKERLNFFIGFIFSIIIINLLFIKKNVDTSDFIFIKASFNQVDGLTEDSKVRMSGVEIGKVIKMQLVNNKPVLSLAIDKKSKIPTDSSLSIQTDGLFGKKFLTIEVGGSDEFLDENDEFMFTEDSILIQDLMNQIIKIGNLNLI